MGESIGDRRAVAILHAGEMGARLAELLRARGHIVLGVDAGRSAATRRRARAAGLEEVGSLPALAARADLVLSLVSPNAAEATARAFAAALPGRETPLLFADLNSIGPGLARQLSRILEGPAARFVDGAIHGQARELHDRAVLFLSGPAAPRVAELFEGILAVRLLGAEVGAASAMKMLLACLSKSLVALCLEVGTAAREAAIWPEFWQQVAHFYPELAAAAERMAATLPRHASRRVAELAYAEATLRELGCNAGIVRESRRLTQEVADARLPSAPPDSHSPWQLAELLESLRAARLRGDGAVGSASGTAEERMP